MPLEYSLIQVAGITELGAYVEAASLVISSSPRNGRFVRPALPVDHSAKIGVNRVRSGSQSYSRAGSVCKILATSALECHKRKRRWLEKGSTERPSFGQPIRRQRKPIRAHRERQTPKHELEFTAPWAFAAKKRKNEIMYAISLPLLESGKKL